MLGVGLKVSLLGTVSIGSDEATVDERRFPGRQGRLVFACLLSEPGRPVPRDELADVIWGDSAPATWDKALAVLVSKLRTVLDECGVDGAAALTSAFGCYRLELPAGSWVDLVEAEELVAEAETALERREPQSARSLASRAVELLRRPFLPGEDGDWVVSRRAALQALLARALACQAEAEVETGHATEAVSLLEEAVALEPYRESGYRALMKAHVAAANPAEALRVYERCRRFLADELGTYPSAETESLFRELLNARPERDVAERVKEPEASGSPERRERSWTRRLAVPGAAVALTLVAIAVALLLTLGHSTAAATHVEANSAGALDIGSGKVVAQVRVGSGPSRVASGGGFIWVANVLADTVSQIDPASSAVRQTIAVDLAPTGLAFGHRSLWVVSSGTRKLLWVDPQTSRIVKRIPVGNGPSSVALTTGREWVANRLDDTVTEISAAGHVLRTFAAGANPSDIAGGDGAIWIANESASTVTRLDPRTGSLESVAVGNGPAAITFADGSVWVANALDGTVSRIDPNRNTVAATIPVGLGPSSVSVAGDEIWVANSDGGTISRIDPRSDTVVGTIGVDNAPQGLAAAGSRVWVSTTGASAFHRGGTLRLVGTPDQLSSIDPALGYSPLDWTVLAILGDGLVGFKRVTGLDGGTLEPDLATSLPVPVDGGRTYTFRLRSGVEYSDGEPVRASDVRRAIERDFLLGSPGAGYYAGLIGAPGCSKSHCDLSKGVVGDDRAGVVTFHLTRPDPEFLYKLALPFADLVPGIAGKRTSSRGVPGTGPYMVDTHTPSRLVLVRNPHFREWSPAAQPRGYPNRIVWSFTGTPGAQTTEVERGTNDLILEPPTTRYDELATRHASQLHIFPLTGTFGLFLNTRVAPFDKLAVRRAFNYAVDRAKVPAAFGGLDNAVSTCQILPVGTPGYRPHCLYTTGAQSTWTSPNLPLARRLVAGSGTRGERVAVYAPTPARPGQRELAELGVATLDRLGFRARLKLVPHSVYFQTVQDPATHAQAGFMGTFSDYPAASDMLSLFTCHEAANGDGSASQLCNHGLDRAIDRALVAQVSSPTSAPTMWARIDTQASALAPWVPLATPRAVILVSRRVRNLQFHPEFGPLVDQMWLD